MSTGFCVNAFAIESSSLHGVKNMEEITTRFELLNS